MTGIILAGGKGRRFRPDKTFLKLGNQTIIERQLKVLRKIFNNIIIVTNNFSLYNRLNIELVSDLIPNKGSLGGIYTGLVSSEDTYNFICACDMPFMNEKLIRYMLSYRNFNNLIEHKSTFGGQFRQPFALRAKGLDQIDSGIPIRPSPFEKRAVRKEDSARAPYKSLWDSTGRAPYKSLWDSTGRAKRVPIWDNINNYDIVIAKSKGRFEPLYAVYSKTCIRPIEKQLQQGNLKISDFFSKLNLRVISEEELDRFDPKRKSFININTKEDYIKYARVE